MSAAPGPGLAEGVALTVPLTETPLEHVLYQIGRDLDDGRPDVAVTNFTQAVRIAARRIGGLTIEEHGALTALARRHGGFR